MVELVDTYALGAYAARCAGSNPVPGTTLRRHLFKDSSRQCGVFSAKNMGDSQRVALSFAWRGLIF